MTNDEAVVALSAQWATAISDPAPEPVIFQNWIRRYGISIMQQAVVATVARYNRGGLEYDNALRYCAATARRKLEETQEFKPPASWTR
jgi:hypothetical protein